MNARDADAVAALYATDAEVLDVVSGVVTCGRDNIRAVNAERFGGYSDYSLERLALVIDGDASSDRWVMRGTHDGEYEGLVPTGRSCRGHRLDVHHVRQRRTRAERHPLRECRWAVAEPRFVITRSPSDRWNADETRPRPCRVRR